MVGNDFQNANAVGPLYSNVVLRSALKHKSGLKLCCFNPESMFNKLDEIKSLLNDVNMDVICITESWLKPHISDASISITGFNIYRNDRIYKRGGGICIYTRSSIAVKEMFFSSKPNLEVSVMELTVKYNKLLLVVVYKPPRANFHADLEEILNNFSLNYSDIILCGDFNQNLLNVPSSTQFINLLDSFSLKVQNREPTYFCGKTTSFLDLVITNTTRISFINQVSMGWKHDFLFFTYDLDYIESSECVTYRDFKNIDMNNLVQKCSALPWQKIFHESNVDIQTEMLNEFISELFESCVPLRTVKIQHSRAPWFDNKIDDAIAMRNFTHHLWKRTRKTRLFNSFKKWRNRVNGLIRDKKTKYLARVLDPKIPADKFWRNIKKLGIKDSTFKSDPRFTAADFLDHFSATGITSGSGMIEDNVEMDTNYGSYSSGTFAFRNIDLIELKDAIFRIKSNSIGLDGISLQFTKLIFPFIGKYLLHIFNSILTSSNFPKCWKNAKILPIPKVGSPSTISDYRPISLLPALSKAFERILQQQISQFLNHAHLLNDLQSAYRRNCGTNQALLNIIDDIRRKADNKKPTFMVLLDFSKAFDTVNHGLLIGKLKEIFHFTSSACCLVNSYLSDRNLLVYYNLLNSKSKKVNCGLPQGSVLGPLLFTLYINDLPNVVRHCNYHLFADDLQIYLSCLPAEFEMCINKINDDIQAISRWSSENRLKLNAGKSQCIVVYKNQVDTSNLPSVKVNDDIIPFSDKITNLGLIVSKDLNWIDQVNCIRKRVNFMLRRLWTVTKCANVNLKRKIFLSYVFPYFLYCDTTLFGMLEYNFHKIQLLFNAGVRYIYGIRKFEHISPYINRVLGCNIREYYIYRVCLSIYKLLLFKQPDYLFCKLKRLTSIRSSNLLIPRNNSDVFNKSFFVRGISLWNSLPHEVKTSHSAAAFKRNYFNFFKYVI